MTPKTTREKWLVSLLPAFGLFFLGWIFFVHPVDSTVTALRARVDKLEPIATKRAQVAQAQAQFANLQMTFASKRAASAKTDAVFDRNRAMQQVSQLCAANHLSLDSAALETSPKLPAALQEATPALTHNVAGNAPQVWRTELTGGYGSILNLLAGLQKAEPLIVPLSISMQTGKTERQPAKWVLVLWL